MRKERIENTKTEFEDYVNINDLIEFVEKNKWAFYPIARRLLKKELLGGKNG